MKQRNKNTGTTAIRKYGWLPLVAFAAMLAACTADDTLPADGSSDTPVAFTTSLQSVALPQAAAGDAKTPATRTAIDADGQTVWATGDAVGIFMLSAGGTIPGDILSGADNIKYNAAPSTGALSPAGTSVYYPRNGKVDFIALYPYSDRGTGYGKITDDYRYTISVADQRQREAIDVLYAKAKGQERSKTPVALKFDHVLSKIMLDIKPGGGLTGLTADKITAVTLVGMPATATLSLQDGSLMPGDRVNISAFKATTPSSGATATFTALVPPQAAGVYTRSIVVTVNGVEYSGTIPAADAYASNEMYIYPVTVQKSGIYVGTPTIARWNTNYHGSGTAEEIGKGIAKVYIPAGTFLMGSPDDEPGSSFDEHPQQSLNIGEFWMSKYEITNAQYAAFLNAKAIGDNGEGSVTYDDNGTEKTETKKFITSWKWGVTYNGGAWKAQAGYEKHPVVMVSWFGAKAYADWIGGALPTEAQWEYACRAGTTTPFGISTGTELYADMANFNGRFPYKLPDGIISYYDGSGGRPNTFHKQTTAVGIYPYPNAWGLYDMHGNVFEWCSNYWTGSYSDQSMQNPDTRYRVLRGGGWDQFAKDCRSAVRIYQLPHAEGSVYGFRVIFVR